MKKVVIFGMVGLMLAFGVSAAFADPVSGNIDTMTIDGSGSSGSQVSGQGDVNGGGVQTIFDHKSFDTSTTTIDESGQVNTKSASKSLTVDESGQVNTKTYDSNNTKTIASGNTKTIDESGQINTTTVGSNNTKTYDSNNTKTLTVDESGQNNALCATAEKNIAGSQAVGSGNTSSNTNNLGSGNTETITAGNGNTKNIKSGNTTTVDATYVDLNQYTKNGSAASFSGNATVNKDSGNTVTVDKSGQTNKYNKAYDTSSSAVAQDGGSATNTYSNTKTVDESGQVNWSNNTVGSNNTETCGSNNTKTIDKSGQVNCSYNAKGSFNSTTVTKNSGNTVGSGNTVYAVDDQVLVNNNCGLSVCQIADGGTPSQNLSVNKTFSNSVNDSIKNVNGVVNAGQTSGNFNGATASTSFTLNGGVANH